MSTSILTARLILLIGIEEGRDDSVLVLHIGPLVGHLAVSNQVPDISLFQKPSEKLLECLLDGFFSSVLWLK